MRARASDRVHRMFTLAANRTAVKADRRRTAILVTAMDVASLGTPHRRLSAQRPIARQPSPRRGACAFASFVRETSDRRIRPGTNAL